MLQKLPIDGFEWRKHKSDLMRNLHRTMMKNVTVDIYSKLAVRIPKNYIGYAAICNSYSNKCEKFVYNLHITNT